MQNKSSSQTLLVDLKDVAPMYQKLQHYSANKVVIGQHTTCILSQMEMQY
jgi:hypothetical protein